MRQPSCDLGYLIPGPDGRVLRIPFIDASEPDPSPADLDGIRRTFDREGYVVVRGLVPALACEALRAAFKREVAPSRDYFLRHASGMPERHVFTEHGHMRYPLMNLQDLRRDRYGDFQRFGLDLLTHADVQAVVSALYDRPGMLVHSMYFEGNQETWAHHDSYYIDAEEFGRLVGIWVALEDIHPGAGRFYVCPRSHRIPLPDRPLFDPNQQAYKDLVVALISANGLEVHAPALRKGDALFWSGRTIHGSLPTLAPERSRSSLTGHFIPEGQRMLWFRAQEAALQERRINGVKVHQHVDLDDWRTRARFWCQGTFPKAFKLGRLARDHVKALLPPGRLWAVTR